MYQMPYFLPVTLANKINLFSDIEEEQPAETALINLNLVTYIKNVSEDKTLLVFLDGSEIYIKEKSNELFLGLKDQ